MKIFCYKVLHFPAVAAAIIVVALLSSAMITPSAACNGISTPEIALSELHSGCHVDSRSRHPDCVAAMHRYCLRVTYPTPRRSIGISREHTNYRIGLSCITSHWNGNVLVHELRRFHGGCQLHGSQGSHCLAATHRFCTGRFGNDFAGISQEVGPNFFKVNCFRTARKENVRLGVLTALHSGCTFPNSYSPACFAAASRWCHQYFGFSGGITQEVNRSIMTVACYNADYSGDAFTIRINDFYRAMNQVREVCDLTFNLTQGQVLETSTHVLKSVVYDNRYSNTKLQSSFKFSKEMTETSSFKISASPTKNIEHLLNFGLPTVKNGTMSLGTAQGIHFYTRRETSRTKNYSLTSTVEVPRYTRLLKEARVTSTKIQVPWSARIVNGLGRIVPISGTWYGVSTHDLKIKQNNF